MLRERPQGEMPAGVTEHRADRRAGAFRHVHAHDDRRPRVVVLEARPRRLAFAVCVKMRRLAARSTAVAGAEQGGDAGRDALSPRIVPQRR